MVEPAPKVLVIDDSSSACLIFEGALAGLGFEVLSATHGAEGIELAVKERPSCIVLDVMMPNLNGYQVCQVLRSLDGLASVPIIIYSAHDDVDGARRRAEIGATDYMLKPAKISLIRDKISRAIQQARESVSGGRGDG